MNPEQPTNQTPPQPSQPSVGPAPITPGYAATPSPGPAPDPQFYQPATVTIASTPTKLPIPVIAIIGVTFLAAVGLLVAVLLLM